MLFLMKPIFIHFDEKYIHIIGCFILDGDMRVVGFVENTTPLSLESISIDKLSNNIIEVDSGTVAKYSIKKRDKIHLQKKIHNDDCFFFFCFT